MTDPAFTEDEMDSVDLAAITHAVETGLGAAVRDFKENQTTSVRYGKHIVKALNDAGYVLSKKEGRQ